MVKWKKLNKKVAGLLLGVMVLFSASTTAFAYVDPSAEATNTEMTNAEAPQTETTQKGETPVEETDQPAEEGLCRKIIQRRRKKMLLQNREMGKSRMISRMDPVKNSSRSQQRITIPFIL